MTALPTNMSAMLLTGHGGLDKLEYSQDVAVPEPAADEVQIEVGACGMNNTDINTRTAWYSKSVAVGTESGGNDGFADAASDDSTWGGSGLTFPRIQGADVAGTIIAVGEQVSRERVGERVLVDPWLRHRQQPLRRESAGYLGSERDGGFAQYVTVPEVNAFAIDCNLGDAELATFPCSSSTAEYMLTRVDLQSDETILIPGASGGVGSALVQLAKRRGARVYAIAGRDKLDLVSALGAVEVFARDDPQLGEKLKTALPQGTVNVVADIVGGDGFAMLIELLARGGRYVTSGAIAGPMVALDLRILYLNDLQLHGATVMPPGIFANLVGYIEKGEIKPLLAKTFALRYLKQAQQEFLKKQHVGNFVIIL